MDTIPTLFGEQKLKGKKPAEPVIPVSKIDNLESLVIEKIGKIVKNLEESKPDPIDNLQSLVNRYGLTLENIQKSIVADYKDKKNEDWLDIYLLEYKEKKQVNKDILRLKLKQEDLFGEENLRFLVKDNYMVLIHIYSEDMDKTADKVFRFYKQRFGMKEVDVTYTFK